MPCLRLFLAWIMMMALPLQGFAAASMLFCGPGSHGAVLQQAHQHHGHTLHGDGDHHHDHAAHGGHSADHAGAPEVEGGPAELPHKCGLCSACCHAVALSGGLEPAAFDALPQASPAAPRQAEHSRASLVPDKPPRA